MDHDLKRRPAGVTPALFAQVKRLRERWIGDDRFRAAMARDPVQACRDAGLALDPRPLAFLRDAAAPAVGDAPEAAAFQGLAARAGAFAAFCADDSVPDARLAAWRARQKARSAFDLGIVTGSMNPHVPFAVELTEGCSVGCWFCGLSAARLGRTAAADGPALDGWRGILEALAGLFGPFASRGPLFWATDPFDHPQYEAFAEIFSELFGSYPMTTTALPLADPGRTRRLIRRLAADRGPGLRFSVASRRALDAVHATFSADELIDVDLVLANRESLHGLATAGRMREKAQDGGTRPALERHKLREAATDAAAAAYAVHETIACVSGFLISLPARRVRLVSPVRASDRWPNGYAILYEAGFSDADELAARLADAVERHMPVEPAPDMRLALAAGMTVRESAEGLAFRANGHQMLFARRSGPGALPRLADRFRDPCSVEAAVSAVADGSAAATVRRLSADTATLWRHGVLVEPAFLPDSEGRP